MPIIDRDGDLDMLISTNNGPACLFRNDGGNRNHWLQRAAGRNEIEPRRHRRGRPRHQRFRQAVEHGPQRFELLLAERSALTFGLGAETSANVEIDWPSGTKQQLGKIAANQFLKVDEGRGIVGR